MAITQKERKRLEHHKFSEDKKSKFGSTYMVAPEIKVSESLSSGISSISRHPECLLMNVPEALIVAGFVYFMLSAVSTVQIALYSIVFFLLEIIVASPIASRCKILFANLRGRIGTAKPILISLGYLQPLSYMLFMTAITLLAIPTLGATQFAYYSIDATIILLLFGFILHVNNLHHSLSAQALHSIEDKDRSAAVTKSWSLLSSQSARMLLINAVAFILPLLALLWYAISPGIFQLGLFFVLFMIANTYWQAVLGRIYVYVSSNSKDSYQIA